MPLSRNDQKKFLRATITFGEASGLLADGFRWQQLTSAETQVQQVLWQARRTGRKARDVLDMMEENDGP